MRGVTPGSLELSSRRQEEIHVGSARYRRERITSSGTALKASVEEPCGQDRGRNLEPILAAARGADCCRGLPVPPRMVMWAIVGVGMKSPVLEESPHSISGRADCRGGEGNGGFLTQKKFDCIDGNTGQAASSRVSAEWL